MFHIYADGKSIYEPIDDELIVNSPKLTLEMGKAGALQFIVPPSHRYYSLFQQLKTIVTVELDGVEIFRGRVLSNNRNFNNMRTIYCEGNLAYLVDSVQKGKKFKGTTHELFRKIVQQHNARVEAEKEFRVGTINIEDREIILSGTTDKDDQEQAEALETTSFDYEQIVLNSIVDDWQTSFDYIETCLIDYCGGYLRTRRVGNVNYLDLITDYGNTAVQEIEFGTNLLDLTEEVSAEDVFTVLIPLGDDNLTIAEVNHGSDELVDTAGVERYGRIVKTHVFDNVNKASTLLENARRFMASHVNMPITITVKAVDMHLVDKSVREIYVGDRVHVNSLPHNIVDYLTCTKIEYDLDNPANNTYTFGNPRQTMTERYRKDKAKANKDSKSRGGKGGGAGAGAADEEAKKDLDEFFDAWINVDKDAAHIDLGTLYKKYTGDRETLESFCGISLDAPSGNINIKTLRKEFDELGNTVTEQAAYIDLLNNELGARIDLVASNHKKLEDLESTHYATLSMFANELEAKIDLNTKHLETLDGRISDSEARISMLANDLKAQITLEAAHKKELDGKIASSNAKIDMIADDLKAQITLEAAHKKELDGKITTSNANITMLSNDLKAQITLEAAHKKELDGKITTSNTKINQVASDLQAQITLEAAHKKELDGKITSSSTKIDQLSTDLRAQITLEANHKSEIDGKITSSNTKINQVASDLQAQITLEAKHKGELDGKITSSNTKINQVASDLQAQITLEAKHKKGLDESIASIQLTASEVEGKLRSEIKLKADTVTVNATVTKINGRLESAEGSISTLNANYAKIDTLISNKVTAMLTASANITCGTLQAYNSIKSDSLIEGKTIKLNGKAVATQEWVDNKGFLTSVPSSLDVTSVKADSMQIGVEKVATQYWCNVTKKFATQEWVLNQLANYASSSHSHTWAQITGKPTTFTPARHRHDFSGSASVANGHTHKVKISGTEYTTGGVSTNATHSVSISGHTDYN